MLMLFPFLRAYIFNSLTVELLLSKRFYIYEFRAENLWGYQLISTFVYHVLYIFRLPSSSEATASASTNKSIARNFLSSPTKL